MGAPALASRSATAYLKQMNLFAVQLDIAWENKPANFQKVRHLLTEAQPPKGSVIALPEMFATGFSMSAEKIAEAYAGPTEQFLSEVAREYAVYLIAGAAMRDNQGVARNKALVFGPNGELIGFYAKMKPFSPGGEHEHYIAGKQTIAFRVGEITLAPFICYDLRFPELFRRVAAERQPELFVIIASWPEKRIAHWVRLLQARAIENQAYVVGVNRIGKDPFYNYVGRSLIVDYNGEILTEASDAEVCIRASLDLAALLKYRTGLPFLEDLTMTERGF